MVNLQEKNERFARLNLILKDEGLTKLQNATVMVVGLGGVGASCAQALARGGVGNLIVIDGDVVDITNINRQLIAFTSTIGRPKTAVMTEMIHDINSDCQVYPLQKFVRAQNIEPDFASFPKPDYVIDCIDHFYGKVAIIQWCIEHQVPLLSSMGAANKLDPGQLLFDYIENTSYCRMSKTIRLECKELAIKGVEVLYSKEKAVKIESHGSVKKADTLGSTSYMPPIMGMTLASKVIRRLAGLEDYDGIPKIIE